MLFCILSQYRMERVKQEQAALAHFFLWEQPWEDYFQNAIFIKDLYTMYFSGLHKVLCFGNRCGSVKEIPELAGDPFGPQGGFG